MGRDTARETPSRFFQGCALWLVGWAGGGSFLSERLVWVSLPCEAVSARGQGETLPEGRGAKLALGSRASQKVGCIRFC